MSKIFERGLRASGLVILVAVVGGVALALGAFWIALVDVYHCFALLVDYANPSLDPRAYSDLRSEAVTTIVKALDGFLIGALPVIPKSTPACPLHLAKNCTTPANAATKPAMVPENHHPGSRVTTTGPSSM
jgi:hypothetical protein